MDEYNEVPIPGSEPCHGCNLRNICAYFGLACESYRQYVEEGDFVTIQDTGMPTSDIYATIYEAEIVE